MKMKVLILVMVFGFINAKADESLVGAVVAITGNVLNEVTRLPETVVIQVNDMEDKKIAVTRSIGSDNGYYYVTGLKSGLKYKITLKKKGFFNEEFLLEVPNSGKYLELSRDFLVKNKEIGTKIKLPVPPFEFGKSKLRFGVEQVLGSYAQSFALNSEVKFEITCFPDVAGDEPSLTTDRASSLKEFFVAQGIDASRISVKGSKTIDTDNPPPTTKTAKGKRYIGTTYLIVTGV